MGRLQDLKVRQVDSALGPFLSLSQSKPPDIGWVKTIRDALGMSIRQLATRTSMSKTSVASVERSEAKGSVQMDSLRKLAEGLNCELVYALIPRVSLRDTLQQQAEKKAGRLVGRVSDTMDLEAQGISSDERLRQFDELTDEVLRNRGQDFWDD